MRAEVRFVIADENSFMGPGTKDLLENIKTTSSIKGASRAMNMSYNKALHMLQNMEKELGMPVVDSQKGGYDRGGTVLTPVGEKVLKLYTQIEQRVEAYAQKLVDEKFVV